MSEEHKVYVPLRGTHIQPPPVYKYSAQWYEEQGIELPPDRPSLRRTLTRWLYRAGINFDRHERCLRIGRLLISWDE